MCIYKHVDVHLIPIKGVEYIFPHQVHATVTGTTEDFVLHEVQVQCETRATNEQLKDLMRTDKWYNNNQL
jgi:hypothetical protein